ncbi:MAG TPA: hypothetical protein DHW82_08675 [Spirochaetia bacterium]|nr:MAG: hypothetical protein A2Y41_05035 [Spirochaetes bacterium GWB1_36_13]HCL57064.1 hypothetical protein [Spirochaetia bacterium]
MNKLKKGIKQFCQSITIKKYSFFIVGGTILSNFVSLLFEKNLLQITSDNLIEQMHLLPISLKVINFIINIIFPFSIPVFLILKHFKPISLFLRKNHKPMDSYTAKRILNLPLTIGFLSSLGWIISFVGMSLMLYILQSENYINFEISQFLIGALIHDLILGSLSFVVSFYFFEYINRKIFIPFFFPMGDISHYTGVVNLSTRTRFVFYFLAIVIFPFVMISIHLYDFFCNESSFHLSQFGKTFFIIALFFIISGLVLTFLMIKYYQNPLKAMKNMTEKIRQGDYETKMQVVSSDELGYLGESLNQMSSQLKNQITEITNMNKNLECKVRERTQELEEEKNKLKIRNVEIEKEIEMARQIQKSLIPSVEPAPHIASFYKPMSQVGGDFYEFIPFPEENKIGFFLSDVSGHGIPAAFITSMIKSFILQAGNVKKNPADFLSYLNEGLYKQTADNFITAFYGIYSYEDYSMIYANAGHNPPYVIQKDSVDFLPMLKKGFPLAVFDNQFLEMKKTLYQNNKFFFQSGNRVLLYTDGLTETVNDLNKEYYFENEIEEILKGCYSLSPKLFIENLYQNLARFRGNESFEDDICMICFDV